MADSIREALTQAFDKSDADTTTDTAPAVDTPDHNADPVDSSPVAQDTADRDEGSAPESTDPQGAQATAPPAAVETPAPASWSNEERAAWASVPKQARDAIMRRENEMNRALQASAHARRRSETMDSMAAPYKPLLDSYGIGVEQVIPGLLATRAALEVGTPEQKAQLVANLCADFGLDVNMLDEALSARYAAGRPTERYAPPMQTDLASNPQLAPLFAMAEQIKEVQRGRAAQAVSAVSSDPHYNAVRFTMADLIEKARDEGRSLDLPSALAIAKQFHGLSPAHQVQGMTASDAGRALAAARNAASSVAGAPKPSAPRKPGEGTLRQELEANLARARG